MAQCLARRGWLPLPLSQFPADSCEPGRVDILDRASGCSMSHESPATLTHSFEDLHEIALSLFCRQSCRFQSSSSPQHILPSKFGEATRPGPAFFLLLLASVAKVLPDHLTLKVLPPPKSHLARPPSVPHLPTPPTPRTTARARRRSRPALPRPSKHIERLARYFDTAPSREAGSRRDAGSRREAGTRRE